MGTLILEAEEWGHWFKGLRNGDTDLRGWGMGTLILGAEEWGHWSWGLRNEDTDLRIRNGDSNMRDLEMVTLVWVAEEWGYRLRAEKWGHWYEGLSNRNTDQWPMKLILRLQSGKWGLYFEKQRNESITTVSREIVTLAWEAELWRDYHERLRNEDITVIARRDRSVEGWGLWSCIPKCLSHWATVSFLSVKVFLCTHHSSASDAGLIIHIICLSVPLYSPFLSIRCRFNYSHHLSLSRSASFSVCQAVCLSVCLSWLSFCFLYPHFCLSSSLSLA